MIRLYFSCILILATVSNVFSQLTKDNVKIIDDLPRASSSTLNKKSSTNPQACNRDTVEYPRFKASRLFSVAMRKNYSLAQFYSAPQDITVHGFSFYAYAIGTPPVSNKVRVICNLYKAGSDSLPTGTPLRSDTLLVDSTFGGGTLSVIKKSCNFKNPITLNYPYILAVESDSTAVSVGVVSNDYNNKDGDRMNFLCATVSGRWYRGLSLNISGVTFDADMLLHPHVSYKFGNNFTFNDCFDFKDSARFVNGYKSTVCGSIFYNLYNFYPYDWFCNQWNYGEMPWDTYIVKGVNKYNGKGNYKVRLITRVYQWHLTNGSNTVCSDTTEKILYFKPRDPSALTSTNICTGDSANIIVTSDTGTVVQWFKNLSSSKPVHVGELYKLGVPKFNDTFYVKAYNKYQSTCQSNFSTIIIYVNDYPKNPTIRNDSVCQNARANLGAKSSLGYTEWFMDTAKLPFFFGNLLQTTPLTQDVTYFVRTNNSGCFSPSFKSVSAFVDNSFAPEDPITSMDTVICLRPAGNATLKAYNLSNDTIKWYTDASGGSSIATGNSYTYKASSKEIKTIYVEARKSTCASSRLGINVKVSDYPSVSLVFNDEKCKGDTGKVAVVLSGTGNVKWYQTLTGGLPFDKGFAIQYYTLKSKNLFVEVNEDGCVNPARSLVTIKINAYDSITKIDAPLVCGNAKSTLKITPTTNSVKWYEDEFATKLVSSSATFVTPKLLVSTNYYFTVEKNGCKSPITPVLVEVIPLPVAGYTYDFITGHKIRLTAQSTSGVKYLWKMGDGKTYATKLITHSYAKYGTYNVKLIVTSLASGCIDSASQDILFDFSGLRPITEQHSINVFPNPSNGQFTVNLPSDLKTGHLMIMSSDGKLVYSQVLKNNRAVSVEKQFANGIYFLKVEWDNKTSYKKLVME